MDNAEMDEFVNRVRERSDIYAVVSRYVPLTFKGGRYWACCPFHEEKTASFAVSPEKGMFYCFGCHAGGNVFKFISLIENVSYFDAVKLQAERLGIELPARNKTPEERRADEARKTLLKITAMAQEFYHNALMKTAAGGACRKYLNARGITQGVIEKFGLGFAPDTWVALIEALESRGVSEKQIIAAGLASKSKIDSGVYDRLRGRVIIPIADIFGRVVAFGGRILNSADNSPKYLNTPETEIFSKGRLLFGLDKANRAISAKNTAVVVEGYMDAISLANAGIENVVASLGTAFTAEHAKLLTRYARRVIFCYDSDEAGQRATVRALPIIQAAGAEVFVIVVPDGKDPDEFVRKHGREEFERLIENATPMIDYRIQYVLNHTSISTLDGKIRALNEILQAVGGIKDAVVFLEYCKKISDALLLDENLIGEQWKKITAATQTKTRAIKISSRTRANESPLIREAGSTIIRMAWYEDDVLGLIFARVPKEIFTETHQEILSYLEKCQAEERRPDDLSAAAELSEEASVEVSRILTGGAFEQRENELKAFEDSLKILRRIYLRKQQAALLREAEKYFKSGDEAAATAKLRESLKIKQEMEEL